MTSDDETLDRLLADGGMRTLFHPVYHVNQDRQMDVWALEALVRGPAGSPLESAGALLDFVRGKHAEPAADRACIRSALRDGAGLPLEPTIALNVHAATLGRDEDFAAFLDECIARSGFAPERIIIEVVPQQVTWSRAVFRRNIDRLRGQGIRLAMDDFGVGHASLELLLDIRPHVLKIDGHVVRGCHADYYRWALVNWTQELATRLGAVSLAEGIEDQADLAAVTGCGIRLVQGFVFSRPMPAADLDGVNLNQVRLVLSEIPLEHVA